MIELTSYGTIPINQPKRCNSFKIDYLTFMRGSTCFGRLFAHHQEHTTALAASGFTLRGWR